MSKYERCNMKCDECDNQCDKGSIHYFLMLNVVSRLGIETVHQKPQWWKEYGAAARAADEEAELRSDDYLEYSDEDDNEDDEDMREFDEIYNSGEAAESTAKCSWLDYMILMLMYALVVSFLVVIGARLSQIK